MKCVCFVITQRMKVSYKDFHVYGSPFECHLKSSNTIQVKILNKPDEWTVYTSDCQVKGQK